MHGVRNDHHKGDGHPEGVPEHNGLDEPLEGTRSKGFAGLGIVASLAIVVVFILPRRGMLFESMSK